MSYGANLILGAPCCERQTFFTHFSLDFYLTLPVVGSRLFRDGESIFPTAVIHSIRNIIIKMFFKDFLCQMLFTAKGVDQRKRKITPMLPLCSLGNRRLPTIIK